MKIEHLQPSPINSIENQLEPLGPNPDASFSSWIGQQLQDTNHQLLAADSALLQLASGKADNLHQTMLTLEEAKLSFQFLEQVRNRLMGAYQDLMREQI